MAGRPELEIIDVEPPHEGIRADQGYRVGARISIGDASGMRLAGGVAVTVVLVGFVFSLLGGLGPTPPELPVAPAPSRAAATSLPRVIFFGEAPTRPVPVSGGGLRWLDPATGTMSGDVYTAPRSGLFVDAEGRGLCVCVELPWADGRVVSRVTLRRYAADGEEVARTTLFELESVQRGGFGDPVSVQAAMALDGRTLWIAHAVRSSERWDLGVARVDVASMAVVATRSLPSIALPAPDAGTPIVTAQGWQVHQKSSVSVGIRVSPDGSRIAVLTGLQADLRANAGVPAYQEARYDLDAALAPDDPIGVAVSPHDASLDPCDSQLSAWATASHFVTICSRPDGAAIQPFVRIQAAGDIEREVTVGPPVGSPDTEWLLDGANGALYRWSTLAHVFTRLDVRSRTMMTLALDWAKVGTGDLGAWPGPTGEDPPWAPLAGPFPAARPPRMVGSADGSVIYALGYRSAADGIGEDRMASTGIWVLDARRGQLVARWAPEAWYDQIGFSPGWERLVTIAQAGMDATGAAADWSSSLRFHDERSGRVLELLGDVGERSGFVTSLFAPNVPRGIAGS